MFWQDSMNYDRQAQNYSAEAARYEAMSPGTAPKPVPMNPAQTPKSATPPSAPPGAATSPDKGRQESAPAGGKTTGGTYADREALERQIAGLQSEMQAYSDASGGKGDPQVLIRYANRIHDAMRAMESLPTEPAGENILSYDQMAENYGREAVGNDGMRQSPGTAPKAARSGEVGSRTEEKKESAPASAETEAPSSPTLLELVKAYSAERAAILETADKRHLLEWGNAVLKDQQVWRYIQYSGENIDLEGLAMLMDEALAEYRTPTQSAGMDYAKKTVNQVVLGEYADDRTPLGSVLDFGVGLTPVDFVQDGRNLYYDLTHPETTPAKQTLMDAGALFLGLDIVKPIFNALEAGVDAIKTARRAGEAGEALTAAGKQVDELVDAGKAAEPLTDALIAQRKAEILEAMEEQMRKSGVDAADPAQVLDPETYKKYNEIKARFDEAAKKAIEAGDGEYITYYRVQNPREGSKELLLVNEDGTLTINTAKYSDHNVNISAYNTDHAEYFSGKPNRSEEPYVVAFDVPVWFDELIRENAILQTGSKNSPLNRGGTAPKITDAHRSDRGFTYEFPSFWNEWLEKYATNVRKMDIGDLS